MTPEELLNGLFGELGEGAQDELDRAEWWESSDIANESNDEPKECHP